MRVVLQEEKWADYVDKHVKMESTDQRIQALSKNPVFLSRFVQPLCCLLTMICLPLPNILLLSRCFMMGRNKTGDDSVKALENVDVKNDLKCKICVNSYKTYYVSGVRRT